MNLSTCCCLNPIPPRSSSTFDPTSSPSLLTKNKDFITRKPNEKSTSSSSWRGKKWVVIAATIVLSLEVGDIIISNNNINNGSYYYAIASENKSNYAMEVEIPIKIKKVKKVARWSDKRSCPPWNMNSLETIVPENLPRPSFQRKWEKVSHSSHFASPESAPSIDEFLVKPRGGGCFSL